MPTGIVKWFNGRKGYGFIEPEDGGNDVFVHVTALKDSGIKFLNEGDKVSYELTENRGRMAAGNLSLDGESSSDSDEAPSDEVEEASEFKLKISYDSLTGDKTFLILFVSILLSNQLFAKEASCSS